MNSQSGIRDLRSDSFTEAVSIMARPRKYFRLLGSLALYTLNRELSFRGNFLVKVSVEVLWLAIMLAFYRVIFARTRLVAGWDEPQYLFFVGCFFALNGLIEMFFLDNCNEFSELVRTGDLDGLLLKPIDEQFLITCRKIDWGTGPNVLMGSAVMGFALFQMGWHFDILRVLTFFLTFACGTAIAYAFMLMLTSLSVWMVRNQSLMEMWWLFSSLARYPKEIFSGQWAAPVGRLLYLFPADPDRGQCPRELDGSRPRPEDGRDDGGRDRIAALDQPALLPACPAVLSQREQLACHSSRGCESCRSRSYQGPRLRNVGSGRESARAATASGSRSSRRMAWPRKILSPR